MKALRFSMAWFALVLTVLPCVCSQEMRFELGLRLRQFERAFDVHDSPEFRRATVPHLERAVQSFFQFRLSEAARALDQARAESLAPELRPLFHRASNLTLTPTRCLFATGTPQLTWEIAGMYGQSDWNDLNLNVTWHRISDDRPAEAMPGTQFVRLSEVVDRKVHLKVGDWVEGDYWVHFDVSDGEHSIRIGERIISCVDQAPDRVLRLTQRNQDLEANARGTQAASLNANVRTVEELAKGPSSETDFPAARLLRQCEEAAACLDAGQTYFGFPRGGEYWLRLVGDQWRIPVRVRVPENVTQDQPVPLVLAFHGAGGSENMFFDGYGDGKVVRLCQARNWIVAAPRVGFGSVPLSELVEELAHLYPIDRSRVLLIGHSMGAGAVLRSLTNSSLRPKAVALLGGGGSVPRAVDLSGVRFFVGAGERDFGKAGSQRTTTHLRAANCDVKYSEYRDVEHLVVVQAALADVFEFFDAAVD